MTLGKLVDWLDMLRKTNVLTLSPWVHQS